MLKSPFCKVRTCEKCVYFIPQRDLSITSIIGAPHWKEACRFSAHAFAPCVPEADICFDFKNASIDSKTENLNIKEDWAKVHLCHQCAFWENNGIAYLDCEDKDRQAVWERFHRCHGYLQLSSDELVCSTFLTVEQWKEVESTPMEGFARGEKWSLFRKINAENHV